MFEGENRPAMPTSCVIRIVFGLLLAACLCLGAGCATVKPACKPRAEVVVAPAPDSAFVQWVKDWWNAAPPDLSRTSRDNWGGADLAANLLGLLGKAICH